jgi:ABC-type phosphate/phosphonate transport system substrate-binding protein
MTRARLIFLSTLIALTLVACGGGGGATPVYVPPVYTPTPLSLPLPTVATQAPFGSTDRPYKVIIVPPKGSDASARPLQTFLGQQMEAQVFTVEVAIKQSEALTALCGEIPTVAWVDGWTLLAAQAQGCGQAVLRIQRGKGNSARTGIRSDLVVSNASRVSAISGFKGRAFCRLNDQDPTSWILPVIILRSAGNFDPLQDFSGVRDVGDTATLIGEVSDNHCVGAIPAGTLDDYTVGRNLDVKVLENIVSPEIPYGGLVISSKMPPIVADQLKSLFARNLDKLKGLVDADSLVAVTPADFASVQQFLQGAGIDLARMSQ